MASLKYIDNAAVQLSINEDLKASGWVLTSIDDQHPDTIHNPKLDQYLSQGGSLNFRLVQDKFDKGDQRLIDAIINSAVTNGKSVFNSPKIRMSSDPAEGLTVDLSMTEYFQGLATNEIALRTAILHDDHHIDGTELAFPNKTIPSLAESRLSNHIGACALAFDVDGVLSLVKTGKASMVSGRKIAPSAAGSADIEDFQDGHDNLVECVLAGLKRELLEEQGIAANDIAHSHLIGFQRYLPRGAKPEFIGLIRLGTTWKKARKGVSNEERLFTDGYIDLNCIDLGIDGLRSWIKKNEATLSFSAKQCFWSLISLSGSDEKLKSLIAG